MTNKIESGLGNFSSSASSRQQEARSFWMKFSALMIGILFLAAIFGAATS